MDAINPSQILHCHISQREESKIESSRRRGSKELLRFWMIYSLFERECKRPDSVLLQIIIGALHYLPNPRRQARIRRQQIQQGREANFNNAEMDEKTV